VTILHNVDKHHFKNMKNSQVILKMLCYKVLLLIKTLYMGRRNLRK